MRSHPRFFSRSTAARVGSSAATRAGNKRERIWPGHVWFLFHLFIGAIRFFAGGEKTDIYMADSFETTISAISALVPSSYSNIRRTGANTASRRMVGGSRLRARPKKRRLRLRQPAVSEEKSKEV